MGNYGNFGHRNHEAQNVMSTGFWLEILVAYFFES